jgi:integration host factor subunit beta
MTKADLIEEVSRVVEMTGRNPKSSWRRFSTVSSFAATGDKIEIRGFGSFRTRQTAAADRPQSENRGARRSSRQKIPYSSPGKELKDVVNTPRPRSPAGRRAARSKFPNPKWITSGRLAVSLLIAKDQPQESSFAPRPGPPTNKDTRAVHRQRITLTFLNRFPYIPGSLMVSPYPMYAALSLWPAKRRWS